MADFIPFDFVVTNRQIQIHECGNHRGDFITAANRQVTETAAAVYATLAVPFAPELDTPALQGDFEILYDAVACANFETCLRPVVVPVVVEPAFGGTLAPFEDRVVVPGGESGARNESRCECDFFEPSRLLIKFSALNLANVKPKKM